MSSHNSAVPNKKEKGFSLIELLVALLVMSIVTAGIFNIYSQQQKTWKSQDMMSEMQQNLRVGMDLMRREIMMAGYQPKENPYIETADRDEFEFQYTIVDTTTAVKDVVFSNDTSNNILYRNEKVWDGPWGTKQPVAEGITNLQFTYYDKNNDFWCQSSPGWLAEGTACTTIGNITDTDEIPKITRVKILLQGQTSAIDPTTGDYKTLELTSSINIRNAGEVTTDTSATCKVANVRSIDPNICNTLDLTWDACADSDLQGYRVRFSNNMSTVTNYVTVSKSSLGTPATPSYRLQHSGLAHSATYYIDVMSYDSSGNYGEASDKIYTADPSGNDTTINPVIPDPVTGIMAADGATMGQVDLSWTASASSDVTGYRVFRKSVPFINGDYPLPIPETSAIKYIGNESSVTGTNFSDESTSLVGCQTYYYSVVPINCEPELFDDSARVNATETYGDGAGAGSDSPAGSDTSPDDNSPPDPPVIKARAGWQRAAVTITNPDDNDFMETRMFVAEYTGNVADDDSRYPQATEDADQKFTGSAAPSDPPNSWGSLVAPAHPTGIVTGDGSTYAFWHNDMTDSTQSTGDLLTSGTYFYLAVALDKCMNYSGATDEDSIRTCGEDPVGKPNAVTPVTISGCGDTITLGWTAITSNPGDPASATPAYNHIDFAGYRVFRTTGATFDKDDASTILLPDATTSFSSGSAPLATLSYPDNTVADGTIYSYAVAATDCQFEQTVSGRTVANAIYNVDSLLDLQEVTTGLAAIKPGKIELEEADRTAEHIVVKQGAFDDTVEYHNRVKFYIKNSSAGSLSIKSADITWENESAFLNKMFIGGSPATNTTEEEVYSPASPVGESTPTGDNLVNVTFSLSSDKVIGTYPNATDTKVPVILEFTAEDGTVGANQDMRGNEIIVEFTYKNDSTGTATCLTDTSVGSDEMPPFTVPTGPIVSNVKQSTAHYEVLSSGPYDAPVVPANYNVGTYQINGSLTTTVTADITKYFDADNTTDVDIATVMLAYNVDATKTETLRPAASDAGWVDINMTLTGGISYKTDTQIPAFNNQRIWYVIYVEDEDGNWHLYPEAGDGSFGYDQLEYDPCNDIPETAVLSGSNNGDTTAGSGTVTLSWTEPTQNTDTSSISADDIPMSYEVFRRTSAGGSFDSYTTITGTSYTDTGLDLSANFYSYKLITHDTCATNDAQETEFSNVYAECIGAGVVITPDVSTIYPGDKIELEVTVCSETDNSFVSPVSNITVLDYSYDSSSTQQDNDTFQMYETGNTGVFSNISGASHISTLETTGGWGGNWGLSVQIGGTVVFTHGGASATVNVEADPCDAPPSVPANFALTTQGQSVKLSWDAVTTNTDATTISGVTYEVYEQQDGGTWNYELETSGTSANIDPPGNLNAAVWAYRVKAKNDSCASPNDLGASTGSLAE